MNRKSYNISISPEILELLGPSLYTNIYYVLGELIANSYDADAENVYVIYNEEENTLVVEDDGTGMSYDKGEVNNFLKVAEPTRVTKGQGKTKKGRLKMGRKGIGKLASLAVSNRVEVMTSSGGEKSGFVMSRSIPQGGELEAIREEDIRFEKIEGDGTSIRMLNPEYHLSKSPGVIKKNLTRIFPQVGEDFKIHICINDNIVDVVESFDDEIIRQLSGIVTIGDDFKKYAENIKPLECSEFSEKNKVHIPNEITVITQEVLDELEVHVSKPDIYIGKEVELTGWLGVYEKSSNEGNKTMGFSRNFVSLYANNKMGEFNVFPSFAGNRVTDAYVVGQVHVDIFEDTELPDMALSNRQGYKIDDPRYQIVINLLKSKYLKKLYDFKDNQTACKKRKEELKKKEQMIEEEKEIKEKLVEAEDYILEVMSNSMLKMAEKENIYYEKSLFELRYEEEAKEELENMLRDIFEIRKKISDKKRRLLLSQTERDKAISDIVYEMFLYNKVDPEDIIYSSSTNIKSKIPFAKTEDIYDYLREYFVDSLTDDAMQVVFITSHNTQDSWGTLVEVGATWLIQKGHEVIHVKTDGKNFKPGEPLDAQNCLEIKRRSTSKLEMDDNQKDALCERVMEISGTIEGAPESMKNNRRKLDKLIKDHNSTI